MFIPRGKYHSYQDGHFNDELKSQNPPPLSPYRQKMNDQIDQWLKKEGLASSSPPSKKKDSPPRSNQSQNQKKSAPRDKNKPKNK